MTVAALVAALALAPGPLTAAKLDRIRGGGFRLVGYSTSTKHDYKARVRMGARIVSPETGEVTGKGR